MVLSLDPFQASVRILKAEPYRVPYASDPLLHLLVLLVLGISQRVHKFGVAVASTAVLRRAGVGSAQTNGMFEVGVRRQGFFKHDFVFPIVAKVVFVGELRLHCRRKIGHGIALLVEHPGVFGVPFAVRLAVINAARYKLVQVRVRPAHHDLDDTVQTVELHVRPHNDAPPDGRLAVAERDFQLVERRPAASVGQSDHVSWFCPLRYQTG